MASIVRGFFTGYKITLSRICPGGMLILALLEQFQLAAQHQDFLLLLRQRRIETAHRILLESELALQFCHLLF